MTRQVKRHTIWPALLLPVLSILVFALMALVLTLPALASDDDYRPPDPGFSDPIRLDGTMVVPSGDPGQTISVVIPLVFDTGYGWNAVRDITLTPKISTDPEKWPFVISQTSFLQPVTLSLRKARPNFNFTISQQARAGVYPIEFTLAYVAFNGSTREPKSSIITTYVRVLSDGTEVVDEDKVSGLIVLGQSPTPSAEYSQRITMELQLVNTGPSLTNVSIRPVVSTDLDKFPFVVEKQSYEQAIGSFPANATRSVSFDFLLSEYVSVGAKAVQFMVEYTHNGVRSGGIITAYLDVSKAKEKEKEEEEEKPENKAKPKLIVSSYNIEPEKVYAGNSFTLEVSFTNTSESAIGNITIIITNADQENAYVVPAKNGSNTIYVRRMEAGEIIRRSLEMQVRPDTPAKPNMMSVTMEYENDEKDSFSAPAVNITVPINQEIRVVVEEPRFDNPYIEQGMTAYPYFSILNMGKSSIYNVMVGVEGPGLSLEESLYLGTIQAGTQYGVDTGIIANEPGDIAGEFVISFEDEYGDTLEERLPFTLYVQEQLMPDSGDEWQPGFPDDMYRPDFIGEAGGFKLNKWWLIGGGAVLLVAALIIISKLRTKKRLAELNDD